MTTVRAGDCPGYDATTQTEEKTMTDQLLSRQVRRANERRAAKDERMAKINGT